MILDAIGDDEEGDGIVLQQYPWEGSDRDYEYEEVRVWQGCALGSTVWVCWESCNNTATNYL